MPHPLRPSTSVSIVYAVANPPVITRGTLVQAEGDAVRIVLDGPDADIPPGARVIVEMPDEPGAPRVVVAVESRDGAQLDGRVVRVRPPDKREYPRVHGAVDVGWAIAGDDAAVERWLAGADEGVTLRRPDPFMNFSATGVAFDDRDPCAETDTLLLEIGIPHDPRRWRCLGRVVRVAPIPVDERDEDIDATHRIAVSLERAPDEMTEALGTYTLRIQDRWLEGA